MRLHIRNLDLSSCTISGSIIIGEKEQWQSLGEVQNCELRRSKEGYSHQPFNNNI